MDENTFKGTFDLEIVSHSALNFYFCSVCYIIYHQLLLIKTTTKSEKVVENMFSN